MARAPRPTAPAAVEAAAAATTSPTPPDTDAGLADVLALDSVPLATPAGEPPVSHTTSRADVPADRARDEVTAVVATTRGGPVLPPVTAADILPTQRETAPPVPTPVDDVGPVRVIALTPIEHDQVRYEIGAPLTVSLTEALALSASGAVLVQSAARFDRA